MGQGEEHMKEAWLFQGAVVPVDTETTQALVAEIKRLIDVVGGMALAQRTWVGLTEDEAFACQGRDYFETYRAIEAKLKEKNT
jgi:hypothetical protein